MSRYCSDMIRYSAGMSQYSAGMSRYSAGMSRHSAGMSRYSAGIMPVRAGIGPVKCRYEPAVVTLKCRYVCASQQHRQYRVGYRHHYYCSAHCHPHWLWPFWDSAVPSWGQTTHNLTGLSPKRDCGSKISVPSDPTGSAAGSRHYSAGTIEGGYTVHYAGRKRKSLPLCT